MTKTLSTVGPVSEGKNIEYLIRRSDLMRLNMSHNSIDWHKKNINQIKKLAPNKMILVDIPGIKPRTLNQNLIKIKKGELINFGTDKLNNNLINISSPLPKIRKNTKFFSLSDGAYEFKLISCKNNILKGMSLQSFTLSPKKGLNIPLSIYNDQLQEKKYFSFLKQIKKLNFDCIGLSFIQNSRIINLLRKQYPNKLLISKIENYLGYRNRKEIIENSDAIMIDRGDLSAEVGISQLSEYVENIINDSKKFGKPVIIATENLNSLILASTPSKSDVTNIDYYVSKNVDYIMLSDETATSKKWKNTVEWLNKYLKKKRNKKQATTPFSIEELIKSVKDQTLVVFSKKGYFYEKIAALEIKNLFLFTESKELKKRLELKKNSNSIYVKFPKKNLDQFFYENIKKNKKIIFKDNKFAYLVNVIFPRKNSRANSISIIKKNNF